eukprot:4224508-Pleurochrysis_carterae.AAC.1
MEITAEIRQTSLMENWEALEDRPQVATARSGGCFYLALMHTYEFSCNSSKTKIVIFQGAAFLAPLFRISKSRLNNFVEKLAAGASIMDSSEKPQPHCWQCGAQTLLRISVPRHRY